MVHLKQIFPIITASSTMLLVVFFLGACQSNKPEEIQAFSNLEELPSVSITKLETTIHDSGVVKYKFDTPELKQFDKKEPPYVDFPQGLHVVIYKKTGEIDARIKANWAKYLTREKLWELRNNVEAVNLEGDVLNTEQLFWDETKELVYSDLYTKITTKTEILTGIGFESDQNLSKYTFRKPQGIFEIDTQP
ncbi:MAG: LPS export ABC transporter periplasmic protein LptC [Breznakibacter sp.]